MRELIAVLAAVFVALGCSPNTAGEPSAVVSAPVPAKAGKTVSAELTGYNHTGKTVGAFYVHGEWGATSRLVRAADLSCVAFNYPTLGWRVTR